MGIEKQFVKSIDEKHFIFNKLEKKFQSNITRLKKLDPSDPVYHELYYENRSILDGFHELNKG